MLPKLAARSRRSNARLKVDSVVEVRLDNVIDARCLAERPRGLKLLDCSKGWNIRNDERVPCEGCPGYGPACEARWYTNGG